MSITFNPNKLCLLHKTGDMPLSGHSHFSITLERTNLGTCQFPSTMVVSSGWVGLNLTQTSFSSRTLIPQKTENPKSTWNQLLDRDTEWIPSPGIRGEKSWYYPTFATTGGPPTPSTTPREPTLFDSGDITFILVSMALVFLMIPGLGFFYSGLSKYKSAVNLVMICLWCVAIVSVQWFIIGYSLTFSETGSSIIGNFDYAFFSGISGDDPSPPSDKIPTILFALYQGMFASITPALIFGGAAERFRFLPATLFIILWTTFVYDFLAYWTWNGNGWGACLGGIDFAGGTPVHISSGAAALAYALILGKRLDYKGHHDAPHNMMAVFLGTGLLWFGWFGFNGGSALSANTQAIYACVATNLSACVGGLTWVALDYRHNRKYSGVAFCSGAVAGLVSITPACGFVSPASSLAFGLIGAIICHIAVTLKPLWVWDDSLDVFAVHGIGGITGNLLTGVFAQKEYGAPGDGGGLVDGNWYQVLYQLADTLAGFTWSFFLTLVILLVINFIPGCKVRISPIAERVVGIDNAEHGEKAYDFPMQNDNLKKQKQPVVWHTNTTPHVPPCPHFHNPNEQWSNNYNSYSSNNQNPNVTVTTINNENDRVIVDEDDVDQLNLTSKFRHSQYLLENVKYTERFGPAKKFDYDSQMMRICSEYCPHSHHHHNHHHQSLSY